jgi:hypothetical protein
VFDDRDGAIEVEPTRHELYRVARPRLLRKITVLHYQMGVALERIVGIVSDPRALLGRTLVHRFNLHEALYREITAASAEGRPAAIVEVLHDPVLIYALLFAHVEDDGLDLIHHRPQGTVAVLIAGADRGTSVVVMTPMSIASAPEVVS